MTRAFIVTLMPVLLGGVCNMIFTKTKLYRRLRFPLDRNRYLRDGKRMLGNGKTAVGFLSMIAFCALLQVIWGAFCRSCASMNNLLYIYHRPAICSDLGIGALLGAAYMLFELPNSFMKRRLENRDGILPHLGQRALFFVLDNIDSMFGVFLVLACFYPLSVGTYLYGVLLGGLIHLAVNVLLLLLRLRSKI